MLALLHSNETMLMEGAREQEQLPCPAHAFDQ